MPKFSFSAKIPSPPEKLLAKSLQFEEYPKFFQYLKSVKVLEQSNDQFTTEELIEFTYHKLHHTISQKTITKKISDNKIEATTISGPLKDTFVETVFEPSDSGSKVHVNADLRIGFKYKFLTPIITKRIKMATIALLYKMHTAIEDEDG